MTRANRRQQQGIGCTSTCQRINADTHSTTTRPLNHSAHHSSALREIDTLRQDDAGAVRSETPRPRGRLSSLTTTSLLLLVVGNRGEKNYWQTPQTNSKLTRSREGEVGEERGILDAVLLFLLLRGSGGSAKKISAADSWTVCLTHGVQPMSDGSTGMMHEDVVLQPI